jgi:hypothetical protein
VATTRDAEGTVLYVAPDFDAIPAGFEEYVDGGCCSTRTPGDRG